MKKIYEKPQLMLSEYTPDTGIASTTIDLTAYGAVFCVCYDPETGKPPAGSTPWIISTDSPIGDNPFSCADASAYFGPRLHNRPLVHNSNEDCREDINPSFGYGGSCY